MKSKYQKIHDLKYHFKTWGSPNKPKLFLIHGWMDIGASFHFICEHLQKNYFCIAPDLRGFGKSEHTQNPLGYFFYEYLADLHQIFAKFSPRQKIRLVGHSMGGNIAALYAGTFPNRVSHLINIEGFGVMDMPSKLGPKRMRLWIEGMRKRKFKIYPKIENLAQRLQMSNARLDCEKAKFLAKHISKKVKGGYQITADPRHKWVHPYLHRLDNVYAFWEQTEAKVLNVIAEDTEMGLWLKSKDTVHQEIDRRLKKFPRGSKKTVIKNCGHMVHHEKPQELANLIKNFLE